MPVEILNIGKGGSRSIILILEWTKLVCTPASTALFACPGGTDCFQVRYRHIRQAAIPARVVLGTAVLCDAHARLFRVTSVFTK